MEYIFLDTVIDNYKLLEQDYNPEAYVELMEFLDRNSLDDVD